jgi:P-type Ca2+ transporter type 2C
LNYAGLTDVEAKSLLQKYGPNELVEKSKHGAFTILLRQVKGNFVVFLLTAALIISFFVGKILTTYVLMGVILIIIVTGFIQEYKADKAVNALKKMLVHVSIAIRNGKEKEIDTLEIVPGDILVLRMGEKVPADCVILEEKHLAIDESILTGESVEVRKKSCVGKNYSDENLVFMGSLIVSGKCIVKVLHTGMNTKFGKIANLISSIEKEMPLQKKVDFLAKYMASIGLLIAILTGLIIFFRAESITPELITEILIIVIAVAVSSFPEGFPVVLTTALSLGAYRMAQKNAIINRMSIIETLGETSVICSDKTGTITKGEMTVKNIFMDNKNIKVTGAGYEGHGEFYQSGKKINPKEFNLLLRASILCNDSIIERTGEDNQYDIIGNPTEAALLIMSAKAKMFKEDFNLKRIEEIPFSSERKMMSVMYKEGENFIVYSKGALEFLLAKCTHIKNGNKISKLSEKEKQLLLKKNEEFAKNTLRTIAFAYKKNKSKSSFDEKNLIFIGFVAMEDPPREEVKQAIQDCYSAGIKVKMITGDNKETAISIAKQIGLSDIQLLEGKDLDNITDDELYRVVEDVTIFARVKPEHKLRIVRALKANGEVVTMTGDGVNDAPSLKEAHIGVAMGKNGTDVSRSVADMVLRDDNFASIVDAIKEGRTIFKNIQKFSSYQISINFAQVGLIFFGILIGMPLPLVALQILFINLFSDEILAITLAFNPHSEKVMKIPPRKKSAILNKRLITLIVIAGTIMIIFSLLMFFIAHEIFGLAENIARTVVFLTMVLFSITNSYNFRSFRKFTIGRSLLVNKMMFYATILVLLVTLTLIFSPVGILFEVVPLSIELIVLCALVSTIIVIFFDLFKKFNQINNYWDVLN